MKNTRYAIFLASFIALLSFTACGEVGDKPAPKTTKADSSSVIDSSSVVDSKQDDSSSSDSKTTTTASSKETTSVTTTSIVVLKDGKGNIVTQFAVDENGRTISLGKDSKTTTKKSGSGSSSSGKTSTKKTSNGSSNNTTGSVTYQTNSGGSSGYSSGDSGYSDNGGYSYDDGGNSGSSGGSSGGSGSSGGGAVNTTTTTTTTRAPEPEPVPSIDYSNLIERWLASDYKTGTADPKTKDDYINIGRGLSNDGSDLSKAKAVYKYMLTTYKSERPGVNCISYASATYALCKGIGLDCRYILYSDWYNHVSTAVCVDGAWYDMDTNSASNSGRSADSIPLDENTAFTKMCDEYENYCSISNLSDIGYYKYPLYVKGHGTVHIGLSEEEAIAYHRYGTVPDRMADEAKDLEENWDLYF